MPPEPQHNGRVTTPPDPADQVHVGIEINGTRYIVTNANRISNRIDLELYRQSNGLLTWAKVLPLLQGGLQTPFALAAFIFVARRQAGDRVNYMSLIDEVTYEDVLEDNGHVVEFDPEDPPEA